MEVAYADPPYVGQAKKHYEGKEVNHRLLIAYLETFDGWALSCSSPSLQQLLPMCPDEVRVGAWVKPFCAWHTNPAYSWEPVIFQPVRVLSMKPGIDTVRDYIDANMTTRKGTHGAKPVRFSRWLFGILGLDLEDEFHDIFKGSGAVTAAWEGWLEERGVPVPLVAIE